MSDSDYCLGTRDGSINRMYAMYVPIEKLENEMPLQNVKQSWIFCKCIDRYQIELSFYRDPKQIILSETSGLNHFLGMRDRSKTLYVRGFRYMDVSTFMKVENKIQVGTDPVQELLP